MRQYLVLKTFIPCLDLLYFFNSFTAIFLMFVVSASTHFFFSLCYFCALHVVCILYFLCFCFAILSCPNRFTFCALSYWTMFFCPYNSFICGFDLLLGFCSICSINTHVSHPYSAAGYIIVLYNFSFVLLETYFNLYIPLNAHWFTCLIHTFSLFLCSCHYC